MVEVHEAGLNGDGIAKACWCVIQCAFAAIRYVWHVLGRDSSIG